MCREPFHLNSHVLIGESDGLKSEFVERTRYGTQLLFNFRYQNELYLIYQYGGLPLDRFAGLVHKVYGHFPNCCVVYKTSAGFLAFMTFVVHGKYVPISSSSKKESPSHRVGPFAPSGISFNPRFTSLF